MLNATWLERRRDFAVLLLRFLIGFTLIYGSQDNIFDHARMVEFQQFLEERGVPFPVFSASLSVYAQFLCGVLMILGATTRAVSVVMIINFIAALFIAHRTGGYMPAFPALTMLITSIFFLFNGAGRWSVDAVIAKRKQEPGRYIAA